MMAKIAPVDSQKRWNEKFIDTIKDLDAAEASLNLNCLQLNTLRVNISSILLYYISSILLYHAYVHTMSVHILTRVFAFMTGYFSI